MNIAKMTQAAVVVAALGTIGGGLLAYVTVNAVAPDAALDKVPAPAKADVDKAQNAIKDALGANYKSATLLDAQPILRTFPDWLFFDARFTYDYGVPLGNIEGSSCWAVNRKTFKATRLGSLGQVNVPELKKFLDSNLPALKTEAARKDALWACLRISQEALTDHKWFEIKLQENSISVAGAKASGKSIVTPTGGNGGEVVVTLDATNAPDVQIVSKIRQGPRPICQATRLLDADPVIRAMAEQQLLLIGRNAEDYLIARRAEAASPELRAAIDSLWQRILAAETRQLTLVRPDEKLLRHPDRIVRDMTRQQLRLVAERGN